MPRVAASKPSWTLRCLSGGEITTTWRTRCQLPISSQPHANTGRGPTSGSGKPRYSVRLTAQEYAAVKAAAERERQSPASVLRRAFFQEAEATG